MNKTEFVNQLSAGLMGLSQEDIKRSVLLDNNSFTLCDRPLSICKRNCRSYRSFYPDRRRFGYDILYRMRNGADRIGSITFLRI